MWNTYEKTETINHIIGFGFLAVAIFDILHTYCFLGVRALNLGYLDLSARYWIIGRLIEAVVLYIVTLRKNHSTYKHSTYQKWISLTLVMLSSFGISAAVWSYPTILPVMITTEGLTPAENFIKYVAILINLTSILKLRKNLDENKGISFRHIYMALLLIIAAEIMFTQIKVVTSSYSTYGHILKIVYYYYLYKAVFVSSIVHPYNKLDIEYRKLEQKSTELQVLSVKLIEEQRKEQLMKAEIAQLDRLNLVGEMAAGIGHEVRNPMTTVRGFLQLFQRKKEFVGYVEQINIMIEELDRANAIITEFLSLAKDKAIEMKDGNLNKVVKSLYPLMQADAFSRGHDIHLSLGDIPNIKFDNSEMRQLILNLVRNGFEAMEERRGTVTIRTYLEERDLKLVIEDNGSGIPDSIIAKLGTPFVSTKDEGAGLGLAICYRIADRHRAKIKVSTGPIGTVFAICFPLQS